MSSRSTAEAKHTTKNNILHIALVSLAIILEIAMVFVIVRYVNREYAWIDWITEILALFLVLFIYSRNMNSSMKMPWIILILLAPVLGVFLYFVIGFSGSTKKLKRRYRAIEDEVRKHLGSGKDELEALYRENRRVANNFNYVDNTAAFPVYTNTDVTYYSDASSGLAAQIEAMKKAEKFIFMEYFAIEDKESFEELKSTIAERVKAGVEVRISYDEIGSMGYVDKSFAKEMERIGAKCRAFNPVNPFLNIFVNNRDHRKITIIDGKVGFTGGYNLCNEYFNITHPFGHWKDTGLRIEGDAVTTLTAMFLVMWDSNARNENIDRDIEMFFPKIDYKAEESGYIQPYACSPLVEERLGESVYINLLNHASDYVYFITPYLIITDEMVHAFTSAAKRGVDVRLITPGIPDKKLIYRLTRSYYSSLARYGVRIYEYTPGFCHAKECVCDDELAICGTINLDYRSLYHHFENGVQMHGLKAVLDMKADFEEMFKECREVTAEYASGKKASLGPGQSILRLIGPLV